DAKSTRAPICTAGNFVCTNRSKVRTDTRQKAAASDFVSSGEVLAVFGASSSGDMRFSCCAGDRERWSGGRARTASGRRQGERGRAPRRRGSGGRPRPSATAPALLPEAIAPEESPKGELDSRRRSVRPCHARRLLDPRRILLELAGDRGRELHGE